MELTKSSIDINFQNTLKRAGELDEIADSLRHLSNEQFHNTLEEISGNWKGDNANIYLQKGYTLEQKIKETAKELKHTAQTIRNNAKRIYNAELEAIDLVNQRNI